MQTSITMKLITRQLNSSANPLLNDLYSFQYFSAGLLITQTTCDFNRFEAVVLTENYGE